MPVYYLSVDLESEGDDFQHPVTALGAVFGPADGSWPRDQLIRFSASLAPLPDQAADPACMHEFWAKHPGVYRELKAAQRPAADVMRDFLAYCQQLVARFEDAPGAAGTITLVTDCPDFDLGRLHVLGRLQTQTWPGPIRHLGGLRRHGQVDPSERLDALGKYEECAAWMRTFHPSVVHDHRPVNDAEHSYYQMVFLNEVAQ